MPAQLLLSAACVYFVSREEASALVPSGVGAFSTVFGFSAWLLRVNSLTGSPSLWAAGAICGQGLKGPDLLGYTLVKEGARVCVGGSREP
jgi:hypothetical protein